MPNKAHVIDTTKTLLWGLICIQLKIKLDLKVAQILLGKLDSMENESSNLYSEKFLNKSNFFCLLVLSPWDKFISFYLEHVETKAVAAAYFTDLLGILK